MKNFRILLSAVISTGLAATLVADPNTISKEDFRKALIQGNTELVERSLNSGVPINPSEGSFHFTPIDLAASGESVEMIDLLLERGAEINRESSFQMTALCFARTPEVARKLISKGAKFSQGHELQNFGTMLGMGALPETLEVTRQAVPEFSFEKHGTDLLIAAAHTNRPRTIRWLLENNVKADSLHFEDKPDGTKEPLSALRIAAIFGQRAAMEVLLDGGADPKMRIGGVSAQMIALMNGHKDCVKLLWEKGVRDIPESSYLISQGGAANDLLSYLKEDAVDGHGDLIHNSISALSTAAYYGHYQAAELALEKTSPSPACRATALAMAASRGHVQIVERLLKAEAMPSAQTLQQTLLFSGSGSDGTSARDMDRVLDLLMDAATVTNWSEDDHFNVLQAATSPCNPPARSQVTEKLLQRGINPKARSKSGKTLAEEIQASGSPVGKETEKILAILRNQAGS